MIGQIIEVLLPFLSIMARIIEVYEDETPKRYIVQALDINDPKTYTIFEGEFK